MQRVAIVFPYFRTRAPTELLFPPLGAASLAGQIRRLGVGVRVFDCTFTSMPALRRDLASYRPAIVGVYSMVSLSRKSHQVAEMARSLLPEALLVAGGPLPTLYPRQYAGSFDAVFRGESDLSFPRFCADYLRNGASRRGLRGLPLGSYEGLYLAERNGPVDNPPVHYGEAELAGFPIPDRSDFDHPRYQAAWYRKEGEKATTLMVTLGCPFSCDFCSKPIFGNLFRRRALGVVFEEIDSLRRLGYDSLWIADDSFTLDTRLLAEFCDRAAQRRLRWSCLSRAVAVEPELARLMRRSGCRRIYLGMESGSQEALELMGKRTTVEEGVEAIRRYRQAGIEVAAFFMVGYPGESLSSIEKTFRLALALPLNYISFNVPFPLPGSRLFERVQGLNPDQDWNEENEVTFVYRSEFDARWLGRRIRQTMRAFAGRNRLSPYI
jgi:anaerobic magnesium-protoporphyrin IX monomethyl ester cyclase